MGTDFFEVLEMLLAVKATVAIVMIGEIGVASVEDAAAFLKDEAAARNSIDQLAGRTAPPRRRMGHAGTPIIAGGKTKCDQIYPAGLAAGLPSPQQQNHWQK